MHRIAYFHGTKGEFIKLLNDLTQRSIPVKHFEQEATEVDINITLTEDEMRIAEEKRASDLYDYLTCHE